MQPWSSISYNLENYEHSFYIDSGVFERMENIYLYTGKYVCNLYDFLL